ncbi:MAG: M15 family metallopeptidase [Ignavibacteriae bacterium]|nr:M15 family metallopeptidase [Ignavibacteriota bacterium]
MKIVFLLIILSVISKELIFAQKIENNINDIIIDSQLTFEEAIKGTKAPKDVIENLVLLDVVYYSTDDKLHRGQLVIHKDTKADIESIFRLMLQNKFPVGKVIPIVKYKWSDDASMEDNNTSAFNYRNIAGTDRLSNHSFGKAIDINPFFNPVVHKDGSRNPEKAKYDTTKAGTFYQSHYIVQEFLKRGWRWGGIFSSYADNHHFDKP